MRVMVGLLLLMLAVIVPSSGAQDCTITDTTDEIEALLAQSRRLYDDDRSGALDALYQIEARITALREACEPGRDAAEIEPLPEDGSSIIRFTSDEEGLRPTLTVEIPTGRYLVTLTTDGAALINTETLEGECENELGDLLIGSRTGEASEGETRLFTSEDCRMLVLVRNTSEPWTLEFEPFEP